MRIPSFALAAIVLMTACGGAATAPTAAPTVKATPTPEPTVAVAENATLGKILIAASNKMTLYTFTKDTADTSTCYDACATSWPAFTITGAPVVAAGMTGKLATSARKDGSLQLTHNGKPLYFYNKDLKPGDTIGQNVGTVWFVVSNP
jgi:predicted lipoprotein with Yx(FWY)xxD motif